MTGLPQVDIVKKPAPVLFPVQVFTFSFPFRLVVEAFSGILYYQLSMFLYCIDEVNRADRLAIDGRADVERYWIAHAHLVLEL